MDTHGRRWQHDTCQTCQAAITYSPRYGWRHDDCLPPHTPDHAPTPNTLGKTGHVDSGQVWDTAPNGEGEG